MNDAISILKRHGQRIDAEIAQLLDEWRGAPKKLIESIRYSLQSGGKRIRPALLLEAEHACTGAPPSRAAIIAAAAMEMIHTFSLVHDDLPAMDDDDLRRGRPTNHKVYGEAMAILAGDAMVTMAFEILATRTGSPAAARLIAELTGHAGPEGMIGGQVLDMAGENESLSLQQLQQIHRMKTGALLICSCRMGAIAGNATDAQLDALTRFGQHTGLAFQIVDDILDVTSTSEQLGKATNKDAHRGKNTYPSLLGLEESRTEGRRQLQSALDSLNPFGASGEGLRTLAKFIVDRQV